MSRQVSGRRPILTRVLLFGMSVFLAAGFAEGCGSPGKDQDLFEALAAEETSPDTSGEETVYINLVHSSGDNSAADRVAGRFKQLVEEYSYGRMKVDVFPNDRLGYVYDYGNALKENTVDVLIGNAGVGLQQVISWAPTLTGKSLGEIEEMANSEDFRERMEMEAEQNGMRIMAEFPLEYRVLTANDSVRTLEDLKNLRMRGFSERSGETEYWAALGVETSIYDIHELYSALQQGLVNAEANTIPVIVSSRLYDQQKYVIETKHMVYQDMLFVSASFYDSLTPEQQEILNRAASELGDFSREVYDAELSRSRRVLDRAGVIFIDLGDEVCAEMRRIGASAVENVLRNSVGDTDVDMVLTWQNE